MQTNAAADAASLAALLAAQDRAISFALFDHDSALELGSRVVEVGRKDRLPIAVSIMFGQQRVFHAALAGTNAANDLWLDRKLRVVAMFDAPSLLVQARFQAIGLEFDTISRLDPQVYAAAGGGFPIRVHGSLIGAIAVSGLTDREDHDIAVNALEKSAAAAP